MSDIPNDHIDALRWRTLRRNFGNERDEATPGKEHDIRITLNADACEVLNPDGSLNMGATLDAIIDDEIRIQAHADAAASPPGAPAPEPQNCREAGPGRGLCDQCAAGFYERCRYVVRHQRASPPGAPTQPSLTTHHPAPHAAAPMVPSPSTTLVMGGSAQPPTEPGDAERAAWLADKIVTCGDYAKEAAAMLMRWPAQTQGPQADLLVLVNRLREGSLTLEDMRQAATIVEVVALAGRAAVPTDLLQKAMDALQNIVITAESQMTDDKGQRFVEISKRDIRKARKVLDALEVALASPAAAQPKTEREAFETWANDQGFSLRRLDVGDGESCQDLRTQGAWDAWQARALLATPAPAAQTVVTGAMIAAYLTANDSYWRRMDELPTPPNKWRTGTPSEATAESLRAALAAAPAAQPGWQPIETAPADVCVLLYTPNLHDSNPERVEARVYHNTRGGSRHAWATHWMPLPPAPKEPT